MAEHKPHLALLDLVLPDADGIELMHQVHRIAQVPWSSCPSTARATP